MRGLVEMKGKKYSPEIVEKALALLATTNNICEVAKKMNLPESTVRDWAKQNKDKFEKLRTKKKQEFVENAWRIIEKANKLLEKKLDVALKNQGELDELLAKMRGELDYKKLAEKVKAIKIDNLSNLTTAIGTLYDKQALCNREETQIVGTRKLEDFDE